ncbi:MAG: hypothetical protein FWG72_01965 [Oscillospiraceae bacterium]|nr:hypothetical protein [Oscillospiraceae bacterium]
MITKKQLLDTAASFVETEIVSRMEGWQKFMGFGALALVQMGGDKLLDEYFLKNKFAAALGVVKEGGLIDNEKVYSALKKAGSKALPIELSLGPMGDITVTREDVEAFFGQLRKLPQSAPPQPPKPPAPPTPPPTAAATEENEDEDDDE